MGKSRGKMGLRIGCGSGGGFGPKVILGNWGKGFGRVGMLEKIWLWESEDEIEFLWMS
jgi:hypothetical protein